MILAGLLISLVAAVAAHAGGATTRTVIVVRHCVRATPYTTGSGDPHFRYFNNYSAADFPTWPVAPYQCLPHGKTIVQAEGKALRALGQQWLSYNDGGDLEFIADNCDRDNDTAHALMAGIGLAQQPVTTDGAVFVAGASGDGACPAFTAAQNRKYLTARFLRMNNTAADRAELPPAAWLTLIENMQTKVLGKGVAPPLKDLPDNIAASGWLNGASSVGGMIAEQWLMQLGSGTPGGSQGGVQVAWGKLDAQGVYDNIQLRVFQRSIAARVPQVARRAQSNLLWQTLGKLSDFESGNGTTFYVGHDSNLDQLASLLDQAGLPWRWQTAPFPADSTPPGSALVFRATRDASGSESVSVAHMSARLDGASAGALTFDTFIKPMPLASFTETVTKALDLDCVTKGKKPVPPPPPETGGESFGFWFAAVILPAGIMVTTVIWYMKRKQREAEDATEYKSII